MKNLRIVLLLVLAVAGSAVALQQLSGSDSRSEKTRLAVAPIAPTSNQPKTLGDELGDIDLETPARRGLLDEKETDSLGSGPAEAETRPKEVTLADLQEFRAYVHASVLEVRREEAAIERRAIENRIADIDDTISKLAGTLQLSSDQSEKMRAVLLSQLDLETYYLSQWEQGATDEMLNTLKTSDREARVRELSGFLSEPQLDLFLAGESTIWN